MRRRDFVYALSLLPLSAVSLGMTRTPCPLCGRHLTEVRSIKDDPSLQSVNLEVWNRSYHGDIAEPYSENSPFCLRCHFAYADSPGQWRRASELRDSFYISLTQEIRDFPLAASILEKTRTVYRQVFSGFDGSQGRVESVGYWTSDSEGLRADLQAYADTHALAVRFFTAASMPGNVSITAETPNNSFKPTPFRGASTVP